MTDAYEWTREGSNPNGASRTKCRKEFGNGHGGEGNVNPYAEIERHVSPRRETENHKSWTGQAHTHKSVKFAYVPRRHQCSLKTVATELLHMPRERSRHGMLPLVALETN